MRKLTTICEINKKYHLCHIQSAKLLFVPPKYEMIAIAKLDFSLLLLVKLSLLIFLGFSISSLLHFLIALSKVIAFPERKRATTIVGAIVGRVITIWEARQK